MHFNKKEFVEISTIDLSVECTGKWSAAKELGEFGQVLFILTFSLLVTIFCNWLDQLLIEIIGLVYSSYQVNHIFVLRLL